MNSRRFERLKNEIFDPREPLFRRWSKIFVCTCLIAVSVDLLFFYIPEINEHEKCLDLDGALKITACVLRSIFDLIYILYIIVQFRTGFIAPSSRAYGRGELIADSVVAAKRYLSGYFVIDILSIIPLPQVVVLGIIPILKISAPFGMIALLKIIIFVQYLPRVIRIYPIWKQMPRASAILTGSGTAWSAAASNLLFYILASHVIGSSYYLFSVESELRCWQQELKNYKLYNVVHYYDVSFSCGQHNRTIVSLLNTSCFFVDANEMKDSAAFDFGIFNEALSSHVVESSTYFLQKFFYCFWWGLRNISSFGQNLQTSTFIWEIFFAIFISIFGLVLFSVIIGNMQRYLQSRIVREEEMMVKTQDTERWMSHRKLPEHLRERIRRYEHYKWQEKGGVDEEALIRNLPKDLKRDTKRYLCWALLNKVPMFENMDEHLLDAMCARLKPVLYTEKSYIFREGELVDEMLFIMQGSLATTTTDGGRTGFFNSALLKAGDFCGEELLTWALDPKSSSNLPISTRTVQTISEVEAFALMADDLKFVASQFRRLHSRKVQHTFRFYSMQWRTWAACYIQNAWRSYWKRKMERSLFKAEARLPDALAKEVTSPNPSVSTAVYASRLPGNASASMRQMEKPNNSCVVTFSSCYYDSILYDY